MRKKIFLVAILSLLASLSFVNNSFAEKACTKEYNPVCGVDGITYGNPCMADDVKIKHNGVCREDRVCPAVYDPVCGVDGITYGNSCAAGNMRIAYKGECKILDDVPRACNAIYEPVCGVDGVTYGNKCAAGNVKIAHNGECKEDKTMNLACPTIYLPVVGTDGKTYSNECMAKAAGAFDEKSKIYNEKVLNSYLDFSIDFPASIKDEKEFLKKYGKVCVSASDSINTHFIKDGEIVGSTKIGVPKNFKPIYTCLAFEGLLLDDNFKKDFVYSLEKLSLHEIKKINSAIKNFYKDTKDFEGNLKRTQTLVKKIDHMKEVSKFRTEKPILVLNYIKYQVTELFTQK